VEEGLFVGRHDDLSRLAALVADVSEGAGGVVLVEGEQGIGKTSLLQVGLATAAAVGCRVFWAAADELSRQFPLWLMSECLGWPAAGPPVPTAAAFGGDPVVTAMEEMLAEVDRLCAASPVVLVAEDLQWADEASVLMWYRLSRAAGQMPLLLAGSARPGSGRADLEQLRRGVTSRGGVVLTLDALSDGDVADLVGRLLGGRQGRSLAAVTRRAGGNPLYVRELADSLVRDRRVEAHAGEWDLISGSAVLRVPTSLAAAITDRLAGLPAEVVEALRWAAVLGLEFPVADLSVVTGREAGELVPVVESAVTAGVLVDAGPRLGFRHALIRQVLYEGLPAALRAALHLQAAQALAVSGAPPERVAGQLVPGPSEQSRLARAAGPGQRWAVGWMATNAPTLTYRAPQAAADLLQDLLASVPAGDEYRLSLEASLARAAFQLSRDDQVQQAGAELLTRLADPDLAGEMAWLVSTSELRTSRPVQAGSTIAAALTRPGMSDLRTGRLQALHSIVLSVRGEPAEATAVGQAALERAKQAGDRIGTGYALHAMSFAAMHRRDTAAALALIEQALAAIGDDPQASDLHVMVLANNASCLVDLDRFDEAMAAGREAVVLAERAAIARLAAARFALADQYFSAGQWDDALAELELVADIPGQDHRQLLVRGLIASIAAHRGDRQSARRQLSNLPAGPVHEPGSARAGLFWDRVLLARALIAEQDTGPAAAAEVLAPCLEPDIGAQMPGRYALLPTLVRLARAIGDAKLAAAAAEAAAAEATPAAQSGTPVAVKEALAGHCRGLIENDPGQLDSAAAYLAATSRPLPAAAALEDAAELLAMQGKDAAARRALTAASEAYVRLGASWDLGRAAARLQPFGITPPGAASRLRPATGWAALTPTELKVARLVAKGHSNPDIAARLFLSRNTVQTHVSHILAKLSARSRAQIVAEAFRHSPADGPG
jgi:DNA-binding CsgD family transcriptional regulator/tetratricopeptide (TPR) repeat protein